MKEEELKERQLAGAGCLLEKQEKERKGLLSSFPIMDMDEEYILGLVDRIILVLNKDHGLSALVMGRKGTKTHGMMQSVLLKKAKLYALELFKALFRYQLILTIS